MTVCLLPAIATSPFYIRNYSYQPLDEARELEPLNTNELYQAGPINMKDVWKVGRPIHAWSGIQDKLDEIGLPVVLMSEGNPGKHLSKQIRGTDSAGKPRLLPLRLSSRRQDQVLCPGRTCRAIG